MILRESCYNCRYATLDRVSDITLADFWGIENYDFDGDIKNGVSMILTNTPNGEAVFNAVKPMTITKEFPIEYGIKQNFCLTHSTVKPAKRDIIMDEISKFGYEYAEKKYFRASLIYKIYWLIPPRVRRWIRKLRG